MCKKTSIDNKLRYVINIMYFILLCTRVSLYIYFLIWDREINDFLFTLRVGTKYMTIKYDIDDYIIADRFVIVVSIFNDLFFIHDYYCLRILTEDVNTQLPIPKSKRKISFYNGLFLAINIFRMIFIVLLLGTLLITGPYFRSIYEHTGSSLLAINYIYALLICTLYTFLLVNGNCNAACCDNKAE